jgi:hypothetical protein
MKASPDGQQRTPGYHVFCVLGTDARGGIRPSNPVLLVVRRPSTHVRAAQAMILAYPNSEYK